MIQEREEEVHAASRGWDDLEMGRLIEGSHDQTPELLNRWMVRIGPFDVDERTGCK